MRDIKLAVITVIVQNLLCIHGGYHFKYKGKGGPYRISSYIQVGTRLGNGEGSWTDHNSPQWGGLQMDLRFQTTYGNVYYKTYGTADNWPAIDQIRTGVIAVIKLGSYQSWPNTAKVCGI